MDERLTAAEPSPADESSQLSAEPTRTFPRAVASRWRLLAKLFTVAAIVGVLGLLLWGMLASNAGSSFVGKIASGRAPQAPLFRLPILWDTAPTWSPSEQSLLADNRLALSELRGRTVVINFWASWCIPCRQEAPILHAAARAYEGKVVFLGIDIQDLEGDARGFARKYGMNYGSVHDLNNSAYNAYGLTGVPETYYLNAQGRVISHDPGPVNKTSLRAGIRSVLP